MPTISFQAGNTFTHHFGSLSSDQPILMAVSTFLWLSSLCKARSIYDTHSEGVLEWEWVSVQRMQTKSADGCGQLT